jgi:type 1 fimbria pilin
MFRISDTKRASLWTAILRLGVAVLTGVCLASPAVASCSFRSGYAQGTATITLPANLSVPRNAAVGSILYDSNWVATGPSAVTCSGTNAQTWGYSSAMVAVPGYANVYETGVSGIGIKVAWVTSMSGPASIDDGTKLVTWPASTYNFSTTGNFGPMGVFRVQLIVTGPVSTGTLNLPTTLAQGSFGSAVVNVLTLANNVEPITAPACSVQTPSIALTMPQARTTALPDIGSTTGQTSFNLSLDCSGPVTVAVTFTDASEPTNTSTTLSLSSASTASGVGYQIVYGGAPVSFGLDSSAAGNANQVPLGTLTTSGRIVVPLSARYVRTGTITPGTAIGLATFTMSYQ